MRAALFSDIHGNISGLKAVLADIDAKGGADIVVAAGDIVGGGPGAGDVLDLLQERQARLVRGNSEDSLAHPERALERIPPEWLPLSQATDAWLQRHLTASQVAYVTSLPLSLSIDLGQNKRLVVCHATPRDPWARLCAPAYEPLDDLRAAFGGTGANVIAFGHFHAHFVRMLDETMLVNVASVGLRHDGLSAWTLLEVVEGCLCVRQFQVPYDVEEESRLLRERDVPMP